MPPSQPVVHRASLLASSCPCLSNALHCSAMPYPSYSGYPRLNLPEHSRVVFTNDQYDDSGILIRSIPLQEWRRAALTGESVYLRKCFLSCFRSYMTPHTLLEDVRKMLKHCDGSLQRPVYAQGGGGGRVFLFLLLLIVIERRLVWRVLTCYDSIEFLFSWITECAIDFVRSEDLLRSTHDVVAYIRTVRARVWGGRVYLECTCFVWSRRYSRPRVM